MTVQRESESDIFTIWATAQEKRSVTKSTADTDPDSGSDTESDCRTPVGMPILNIPPLRLDLVNQERAANCDGDAEICNYLHIDYDLLEQVSTCWVFFNHISEMSGG